MPQNYIFFKTKLLSWSKANLRSFPWRRTKDPYKICVAELMLHQTFARKVVPVYRAFIKRYPNIKSLSRANVQYIEKLIYPLGFLYRARRLKDIARSVVKDFGGKFPNDPANVLSLPGVGPYTASAIMCFAYNVRMPIIDANVIRVYSRYFGMKTKLPSSAPTKELEDVAIITLPKTNFKEFNYALLDFAAVVCKHYNPLCPECPVRKKCCYFSS